MSSLYCMTDLKNRNSNVFQINELGFAAIIKLVEARVFHDIENTKKLIEGERNNLNFLNAIQGASLRTLRQGMASHGLESLKINLQQKEKWLAYWKIQAWQEIQKISSTDVYQLESYPLTQLKQAYPTNTDTWLKRCVVVQEAILVPVYKGIDGFPRDLSEVDIYEDCEIVSQLFGLDRQIGRSILVETDKFVKGVNGYWSKVITWTIGGTLIALATAGLAAPAIATAIGGVMGLSGAAAASAGLAFLGGGAIAAGGFGMAGGFVVLVGGGGLLGAATSMSASKLIHNLPTDVFITSSAKIVNYFRFLSHTARNPTTVTLRDAQALKEKVLNEFLEFKHNLEYSLVNESLTKEDAAKALKDIQILEFSLKQIIKISSETDI